MFKPAELECCLNSLSTCRLVVPEPASTSSIANNLATDTGANGHGNRCQQQQNRKTCTLMAATVHDRVLNSLSDFNTKKSQDLPRSVNCMYQSAIQMSEIFQRSPANMVAQKLQRTLHQEASQPRRQATPPPYRQVPSCQSSCRPIKRPY